MTAVINGEAVSHEISQKQYDKFMAVDDYHLMKLFSSIDAVADELRAALMAFDVVSEFFFYAKGKEPAVALGSSCAFASAAPSSFVMFLFCFHACCTFIFCKGTTFI